MNIQKTLFILSLMSFVFGCDSSKEFSSTVDQYSVHVTTFEQTTVRKKVDILFVVDNSTSMARDQANISVQFQNFISSIERADYRIGFINTDASAVGYDDHEGFHGNLKAVGPAGEKYLAPNMSNLPLLFSRAILNQVDSPCTATGAECDEEPMRAVMKAIEKRNTANAGFFRPGASFVPIILTDEDELSTGLAGATQPLEFLDYVKRSLNLHAEDITGFVIAIPPGDSACLTAQRKESRSGTGANYGTLVWSLASLSGGFGVSICHPNFGSELKKVSQYLETRLLYQSILLDPPPAKASSIKVSVRDARGNLIKTDWKLLGGNMLRLIPAPPENSFVQISYKKKNEATTTTVEVQTK
ncbi:MAG: hypothetical protein M9899_04690 [Bdellovibrionaceae bacterium]|nr:hypothetical protein [Pseudobdellovibrionaceae bacterium]